MVILLSLSTGFYLYTCRYFPNFFSSLFLQICRYISNPKSINPEIYCEYFVPHFLYLIFSSTCISGRVYFANFLVILLRSKFVWSTGQTTEIFLIIFFIFSIFFIAMLLIYCNLYTYNFVFFYELGISVLLYLIHFFFFFFFFFKND
jgi:hypothetical protein